MIKLKENMTFCEAQAEYNAGKLITRLDIKSYLTQYGYFRAFGVPLRGVVNPGDTVFSIAQVPSSSNVFCIPDLESTKWASYELDGTFKYVSTTEHIDVAKSREGLRIAEANRRVVDEHIAKVVRFAGSLREPTKCTCQAIRETNHGVFEAFLARFK